MDEGLQELKTEDLVAAANLPEQVPEPISEPASDPVSERVPTSEVADGTGARVHNLYSGWLRLAYMFEFLLALNVVYTLWSEIGGQGHLDLIPWYTKLLCGVGLSWAVVRFTAGTVEMEKFWNGRTRRWFIIILSFVIAMGGIVYYYHLHEVPDESDSEDASATSLQVHHTDKFSQRI